MTHFPGRPTQLPGPSAVPLSALEGHDAFIGRHVGPTPSDEQAMLAVLGVASLDVLIDQTVPAAIRTSRPLALAPPRSEAEVLAAIERLAASNEVFTSLIGQGYHGTVTPPVIRRNVLENPAWYTAYTPYQPEISQGRLEALLNYQTMVSELTGMDLANASMLDEGTAAAEAMTLCRRSSKTPEATFFVDADCHPQTIAVVETRAEPLGIKVVVGDPLADLEATACFGALLQYPGTGGAVRDLRPAVDVVHGHGGLAVVAADLLALTLLAPPGEWGADVVVGSSQRFGVPMGYGASGCPWATAGRTPASSACATCSAVHCRAVWWACPSTPPAARRCGSRCRPGSSTSAGRRRRPTSAPPRCCWP
jgi:glycine dehydrogenase